MARQWILARQEGFEASLEFKENVSVPAPNELGRNKVLVKIKAASLNFRDLSIPKVRLRVQLCICGSVLTNPV